MVLLLVQGLGGLGGGLALSLAPDGAIMRMPTDYLDGSPFSDYLVPGLVLLLVLGVFPLVVLAGLWRAAAWAWYASFAVGCGLLIWLLVEITIIPLDPLQLVTAAIGLAIAAVTLLPQVRRYCGVRRPAG
jgi:uncharacterized membrane protein (DUF2068 family)